MEQDSIIQRNISGRFVGDFDESKWPGKREHSGDAFERKVLDLCRYFCQSRQKRDPMYLPFDEALRQASLTQYGWNPRRLEPWQPAARMLAAVEKEFFHRFGMIPRVELYRSIGTAADVFHGVDCFFNIHETRSVALIDLTVNPDKIVPKSSQHIYFRPDDLDEDRLAVFAAEVVDRLMLPLWIA
jgi:hypothetical protein